MHQAAHGLALTRDILNVSGGDRRWPTNARASFAREVGLAPPARTFRVIGVSRCPPSDSESEKWVEVIAALDAAAGC